MHRKVDRSPGKILFRSMDAVPGRSSSLHLLLWRAILSRHSSLQVFLLNWDLLVVAVIDDEHFDEACDTPVIQFGGALGSGLDGRREPYGEDSCFSLWSTRGHQNAVYCTA